MTWLRGLLTVVSLLAGALVAAFFLLGPQWVDRNANQVLGDPWPGTHARDARAARTADRRGFARRLCALGQGSLAPQRVGAG